MSAQKKSLCLVVSLPAAHLHAATYYISPAGNDGNPGTNVGFAFSGARPDLGPFEFVTAPRILTLSSPQKNTGGFSFQVGGLTSHGSVIVHASSNLTSWSPILTNAPFTGTLPVTDSSATNRALRFYRAEEL